MTAAEVAVAEIQAERTRQDEKWGVQNHTLEWWVAILAEECGEFAEAVLQTHFGGPKGGLPNVRKEASHCAAVAQAVIECLERQAQGCGIEKSAPKDVDAEFWGLKRERQDAE